MNQIIQLNSLEIFGSPILFPVSISFEIKINVQDISRENAFESFLVREIPLSVDDFKSNIL